MTIPPGSLVLVTAGNGLIASHIIDAFLSRGYRVRTTVRDVDRCAWMLPFFSQRHGYGYPPPLDSNILPRLELIPVPDITARDAWDVALKPSSPDDPIQAIAHVASQIPFPVPNDPDTVTKHVDDEMAAHTGLLRAAAAADPPPKSFVHTGSAWAAWTPHAGRSVTIDEASWNMEAVNTAMGKGKEADTRITFLTPFMATRVLTERLIWDWVRKEENKLPFTFTVILPDTVIGKVLSPANQDGSTAGMVRWILENNKQCVPLLSQFEPEWHVDCGDLGLLYLAVLTTADAGSVDGRRIFGFGDRYSWARICQILGDLHPEKMASSSLPKIGDGEGELRDSGWDSTDVPGRAQAEGLLRQVKPEGKGWTSLEDSVREGDACFGA